MLSISIVIPCKNEEKYISRCIDSLLRQEGMVLDREIIVVDNGSTDNTLKILEKYGSEITFYVKPDLSIAELRNFGVEKSIKEWIAFVDADVEVDKYWAKMLNRFLEDQLDKGNDIKNIITGSTCLVPNNPSWVEQVWYEQLMLRDATVTKYINSGNLILHREMFNRLGGFDPFYKTGEEEKLCENARLYHNAIIIKSNDIKAVHHGYPKNIKSFFRRMRWHGLGMSRYLSTPWKSKPLLLATYYLLSTIVYIILVAIFKNIFYFSILLLFLQLTPALLYAAQRYRSKMKKVLLLTILYYFFGWARAFSIIDMLFQREISQNK